METTNNQRPYNELARIASEAFRAIVANVGMDVVGSWGLQFDKYVMVYHGMPSLGLLVDGTQLTGMVIVSLNEEADTYEVRTTELTDPNLLRDNTLIKETVLDVFGDELGQTIDRLIERPLSLSDEEYHALAMNHSLKRLIEQ